MFINEAVRGLQSNNTYNVGKAVAGFMTICVTEDVFPTAFTVTTLAIATLAVSDIVNHLVSPKSLTTQTLLKVAVAGTLATITAVALLAISSIPITTTSVATLAGTIAAPTIAMHLIEIVTAAILKKNLLLSRAVTLTQTWDLENRKLGVKILRELVKQEYAPAYYALSRCYSRGNGVSVNRAESKRLYQIGADKGNIECQALNTANRVEAVTKKLDAPIVSRLFDLSNRGSAHASFILSYHYATRTDGFAGDRVKEYADATEKAGLIEFYEDMCTFSPLGTLAGLPASYSNKKFWFEMALKGAEKGSIICAKFLVKAYRDGSGVSRDNDKAEMWQNRVNAVSV